MTIEMQKKMCGEAAEKMRQNPMYNKIIGGFKESESGDYRSRLISEESELKEKIVKLREFIHSETFEDLDIEYKYLLCQQAEAMKKYHDILNTRLARD